MRKKWQYGIIFADKGGLHHDIVSLHYGIAGLHRSVASLQCGLVRLHRSVAGYIEPLSMG